MNINKYVNWGDIWSDEICLSSSIDWFEYLGGNQKNIDLIQHFQADDDMELIESDCEIDDDRLIFIFGVSGGQNESDTQGWSRGYEFVVGSDFFIISVEYSQG